MNRSIPLKIKKEVFKRDNFTCQKCGFRNLEENEIEVHHINMRFNGGDEAPRNLITLCSICHNYAPESAEEFKRYVDEKIESSLLDTFRKSNRSIAKRTRKGMMKLFNKGILVTRAPLGYKIINKELFPAENSYVVQEIFQEFLNTNTSLTQLAKKYSLSVNGLKKVLTNQTYLGKVKFAGETIQGKHPPLISIELFNRVRNKLRK